MFGVIISPPNNTYFPQDPTGSPEEVALYYRLRFEAAEERYNQMKGLVRAALEKVWCIERENADLRSAESLSKLKLQPMYYDSLLSTFVGSKRVSENELKKNISYLVQELSALRAENTKLGGYGERTSHEDHALREQYLMAIKETYLFLPKISKLQAQITAMEFAWTQAKNLRDELFDYEAKLQEHEMVANTMCLKRLPKSDDVKLFAFSRRNMLELLVEDRNKNINGYYARRVIPLEEMRLQKDAEILELRRMVLHYELKTGVSTSELQRTECDRVVSTLADAETRFNSLRNLCTSEEAKLEALQRTVKHFEDHAAEWKTAHDQAAALISKAERMRGEYDSMAVKLREEDARIMAKKREFEKTKKMSIDAKYDRMRDISDQVDRVEGEIAEQEVEFKRLKSTLAAKERVLAAERERIVLMEKAAVEQEGKIVSMKKAMVEQREKLDSMEKVMAAEKEKLDLVEYHILSISQRRVALEEDVENCSNQKVEEVCTENSPVEEEEDDSLTTGFSGVCV